MCNSAHPHVHPDSHEHTHSHAQAVLGAQHNHVEPGSRRDFLRMLMGTALVGASAMELAYHRAAWANAAAPLRLVISSTCKRPRKESFLRRRILRRRSTATPQSLCAPRTW